jgi:hypothetical protein
MRPSNLAAMSVDPAVFRNGVVIETARGPMPYAKAMDDWQKTDALATDPGWMRAAGIAVPAGRQVFSRAYLERARGHDKTSSTAVSVAWLLLAALRRRTGVIAAASKEQAGLLRTALDQFVRANRWLSDFLEVQAWSVINKQTGSRADVVSSESVTSWGYLIDFCTVDELTVHPNPDLFYSLLSAIAKKETGYLQIITNAGFSGSWQEEFYRQVQAEPNWYFHSLPGSVASWISRPILEEQRRLLPPVVFDRVWGNLWTSGEDSAISDEDLKAAVCLDGPVKPNELWRAGNAAYAGLDIGVKKDRSGFVVLSVPNGEQRIRLAAATSWKPPRGGEVDLTAVEKSVLRAHHDYGLTAVYFDPAQALHTAQRLRRKGVNMVEMGFVPRNLDRMARSLMMCFRERQVELFDHPQLLKDLRALRIEERMAGLRLTAVSGPDGHADLGIAFSIALPAAESAAQNRIRSATDHCPRNFHVLPAMNGRHGVKLFGLSTRQRLDRGGRNPGWRRA